MNLPNFQTLSTFKTLNILAAVVALSACSGASNSLSSPNANANNGTEESSIGTNSTVRQSCSGNCTKTEFTSEPLVNANYVCGTVNDVTGNNAIASCLNNQTLKFFIQSSSGKRLISLGETKVSAIASNNVGLYTQRVTPLMLVTNAEINDLKDNNATAAINLVRFLDAFRTKTVNGKQVRAEYNRFAPVNRTVILDKYKANMDEMLTSDITLEDFKSNAFIDKTSKWLASHGLKVLMTTDEAKAHLQKVQNVNFASVYYQTPGLSVQQLNNDALSGQSFFGAGIGISGSVNNDTNKFINMALYGLTTREGANIGQGMYWKTADDKIDDTTEKQYKLFFSSPFKKMRKTAPDQLGFNVFNNKVADFKWQIVDTNESGVESKQDMIVFNQGQFVRNFAILGNQALKRAYLGLEGTVDDDILGRWKQLSGSAQSEVAKGAATITKLPQSRVSSFFDPEVWRGKHVVNMGEKYTFPLHATLNFTYGNDATACGAAGCNFATGSAVGITILESGDIITDGSSVKNANYPLGVPDCQAAQISQEATTKGKYVAAGTTEHRIGTIRATSQKVKNATGSFINPSIMFSDAAFGELDGVQIGTSTLLPQRVTINIEGVNQAAKSGNVANASLNIHNIVDSSNASLASATWANAYGLFNLIRIKNDENANKDPNNKDNLKHTGQVTIDLSPCYSLETRF